MGARHAPAPVRFWRYVEPSAITGCWYWTGATVPDGYGHFRSADGTLILAHRFSYQYFTGAISKGLQLDHLCRVRNCVQPAHLEPVTNAENLRRSPLNQTSLFLARTHCSHGHEYTEANSGWWAGRRCCRLCEKLRRRRWRAGA
jgi:hypothetical protein